ncbi:MAG: DNA transformation protein [Paracoccaceae bacterium]|jgi:DNA transformation protein
MAVTEEQIAHIYGLFEELGDLSSRKMMGGLTLYHQGQVFAILSSDGLIFLKAKADFADEMAAAGSRIFAMINKNGKTSSMGYWTLPDAAMDEPDLACNWARRALQHL